MYPIAKCTFKEGKEAMPHKMQIQFTPMPLYYALRIEDILGTSFAPHVKKLEGRRLIEMILRDIERSLYDALPSDFK